MEIIEICKKMINENKIDAAWCMLYKKLDYINYTNKNKNKETYLLMYEIIVQLGYIQQIKGYFEEAEKNFIKAEELKKEKLMNTNTTSIERANQILWHKKEKETVKLWEENEFDKCLLESKKLANELENLEYSLQTRKNRKILWNMYELINRLYLQKLDEINADIYDEKAENLAFIKGFDRDSWGNF